MQWCGVRDLHHLNPQVLYSEDSSSRDDWLLAINDTALVLSGVNAPMMVADRYQVGALHNGGGIWRLQGHRNKKLKHMFFLKLCCRICMPHTASCFQCAWYGTLRGGDQGQGCGGRDDVCRQGQ